MRMYEVRIKRYCIGSQCPVVSGHGYVEDNFGFTNYEAYVPSAWSIPYCDTDNPTYIEINPQSCHIDPRCNPVTDECPEVCCKDICILTEGNEDTNFCSKICYPDAPSPGECDYDDALSQYCC